jgi:hypothetical protein
MSLREKAYRDGWIKERKLHMIWRAIARRHLSRLHTGANWSCQYRDMSWMGNFNDGETDP